MAFTLLASVNLPDPTAETNLLLAIFVFVCKLNIISPIFSRSREWSANEAHLNNLLCKISGQMYGLMDCPSPLWTSKMIDLFHKSCIAPARYPTMHHSEQEFARFCSQWCMPFVINQFVNTNVSYLKGCLMIIKGLFWRDWFHVDFNLFVIFYLFIYFSCWRSSNVCILL